MTTGASGSWSQVQGHQLVNGYSLQWTVLNLQEEAETQM